MLSRDEVVEVLQDVLSEHFGIPTEEIGLDDYLQSDLSSEEDCFEEVAANLSQKLERPVLTSDLFADDVTVEQAGALFAT